MRKLMFVTVVCAFMGAPAMAGLFVNYNYIDSVTHDLSSPYTYLDGFTVDTFDGATPAGWTYSGTDGGIVAAPHLNSDGTTYAAPYDPYGASQGYDTTGFFSIPRDTGLNTGSFIEYSETVTFSASNLHYLGLHWGSEDNFQRIEFYQGATLMDTVTGTQVQGAGATNGDQQSPLTNRYVNIFTDFTFDSIMLISVDDNTGGTISPYAFELDNLTVAVPVPGAVLLGMLGLSVAGIKLRKFA